MPARQPIGFFDSGVGGLSIWRELRTQLPHESTIYVADNAHCPYGPRPAAEIIRLSTGISRFLQANHCKLIVVACNTASAAALETLRQRFKVPFVGLEPAVKPAAVKTRTGHIGVLATAGTFSGRLYKTTSQTYANGVMVHQRVGEGLVDAVEAGNWDTPETEALLHRYLQPMQRARVDQLVLGCTHYPFLEPAIRRVVGDSMTVLNPAGAVVRQVARLLSDCDELAVAGDAPQHQLYSTGNPAPMARLLAHLGIEAPVKLVSWHDGQLNLPAVQSQRTA